MLGNLRFIASRSAYIDISCIIANINPILAINIFTSESIIKHLDTTPIDIKISETGKRYFFFIQFLIDFSIIYLLYLLQNPYP